MSRILLFGLNGNINVRGKSYNGQMPAWGGQLKDEQIAAVLTYVRNNWENKTGDVVRPSEVAAARAKYPGRPTTGGQSMTQTELYSIPVEFTDAVAAPAPKAEPKKDAKTDAKTDVKK